MNTTRPAPARLLPILSLLFFLSLISLNALAAKPVPWYLWKNSVDGNTQCAQASPGTGWSHNGTYIDARCQAPLKRSDAPPAMNRTNKMLELMTIIVAARSGR